jgi:hypothetical protein
MNAFWFPSNPTSFLLFFIFMWFSVTTLLGLLSGWYSLMRRFPDRPESPLLTLRNLSGSLGLAGMQRVLTVSVCPSGLRVGIMRLPEGARPPIAVAILFPALVFGAGSVYQYLRRRRE